MSETTTAATPNTVGAAATAATNDTSVDEKPAPGAYYALGVLLAAYILSFVDRNVMAVLIGPIRDDLQISDFQYSLLHGFAFSMFYIVLGIPIARLADHGNRKWIVTIGIFLWSVMCCLCGLARSVATLFVARIGVGVGEAALSPPAFSMLSDLFPPARQARAFAIYSLGVTVGGGLSAIIGGFVYKYFAATGGATLPLLGHVGPWQMTFVSVGAPGLLLVVLLGFIREPQRRLDRDPASAGDGASLAEFWAWLVRHKRIYIGVMGANSLLTVMTYGMLAWFIEFLIRTYGVPRESAGLQFGLINIIAGSLGALVIGWLVQPMVSRGISDAPARMLLVIACLVALPTTIGPLCPTPQLAILLACPAMFLLNGFYGPGVTALQAITPNRMKAQVTALSLFFANLFGLALGPTIVAMLTDFLFGDDQYLRYSLALLPVVLCPLAALLAWQALRPYRELLEAR
ncbi:MFS transporter [Mangrovimicrobium sediminis]|uniref:MFS transporter n=1 Tax=Mangrovimicrobium sediminis TaxID=2562682 RepID=A0A4Z0LW53_9GAMM|nr:MFS transporter [Haliea sp. SAOS-164]TGD71305.1 MFS transporter [Haliea sp. SAOS-164]